MCQYAERRLQEQKEMRELVEQVVEGHKNAKQAKMKLQKYKRQIGIHIAKMIADHAALDFFSISTHDSEFC